MGLGHESGHATRVRKPMSLTRAGLVDQTRLKMLNKDANGTYISLITSSVTDLIYQKTYLLHLGSSPC